MVSERVARKKNHCSAAAAVVIVGIVAITFLSLSAAESRLSNKHHSLARSFLRSRSLSHHHRRGRQW